MAEKKETKEELLAKIAVIEKAEEKKRKADKQAKALKIAQAKKKNGDHIIALVNRKHAVASMKGIVETACRNLMLGGDRPREEALLEYLIEYSNPVVVEEKEVKKEEEK